jgi:hypothetical protein
MRCRSYRAVWFVLPVILVLSGCGQRELKQESVYPARGRVMHKGEPVRFVLVKLVPSDSSGVPAEGVTNQDGIFELNTYANSGHDGAVPGTYKVQLADPQIGMVVIPEGQTPTKLSDKAKDPGITVEIAAEENDLTIEVP